MEQWSFRKIALYLVFVLAGMHFLVNIPSAWSLGPTNNYRNYSVRTTVNVTEAYPEIINIFCGNSTDLGVNYLSAGTTKQVNCTVMLRDYNGAATIDNLTDAQVNATFYYILNKTQEEDNNNTHYQNGSCLNRTGTFGSLSEYVNYSCTFDVWYYANSGGWIVNVTVVDYHNSFNFTTTKGNITNISQLYALNVTDVIDFGQMYVGETTALPSGVQANVTNVGNMAINFSVYGYGGDSAVTGAGLAMICTTRNLTSSNERYGIGSDVSVFEHLTPINGTDTLIPNITIQKQTQPGVYMRNATYWAVHINVSDNPFGICNGTVVFSARVP